MFIDKIRDLIILIWIMFEEHSYQFILIIFGMSQHVGQNLLLRIMGKLYVHKWIVITKVSELKSCVKIKVSLNGMSLLRNIVVLLGLEYVHQKSLIMKYLQVLNL